MAAPAPGRRRGDGEGEGENWVGVDTEVEEDGEGEVRDCSMVFLTVAEEKDASRMTRLTEGSSRMESTSCSSSTLTAKSSQPRFCLPRRRGAARGGAGPREKESIGGEWKTGGRRKGGGNETATNKAKKKKRRESISRAV